MLRTSSATRQDDIGKSGSDWRALAHPERPRPAALDHRGALPRRDAGFYECEFRIRHKRGHWVWLLSRGKIVERDDFGIAAAHGRHAHGPDAAQARSSIRSSAPPRCCAAPASWPHIGGWELDLATGRLDWTEQVCLIHELEPGYRCRTLDERDRLLRCPRRSRDPRRDRGRRPADGTPWDLELPFITARGNDRWVRAQGVAVYGGRQARAPARRLPGHHREEDIDLEMHRLNEELTRLSTTDSLTEIGNRRLFDQTLKSRMGSALHGAATRSAC